MDLNSVAKKERTCDSPDNVRAPECTKLIQPGERYHHWIGSSKGRKDIPFEHPDNWIRYCIHCVRSHNWEWTYKNKLLLVRVELTFSDGSRKRIEDDAADEWQRAIGGMSVMSSIHGGPGKEEVPWQDIRPGAVLPAIDELHEHFPRWLELATRLVAPGKAGDNVSASEMHELAEGVHALIERYRKEH